MLQRKEPIIKVKSEAFAIRVIKMYKYLNIQKNEYILSKQILRSGTSVGANVNESRNAQSTLDFINKLSIALKRSRRNYILVEMSLWWRIYHRDAIQVNV